MQFLIALLFEHVPLWYLFFFFTDCYTKLSKKFLFGFSFLQVMHFYFRLRTDVPHVAQWKVAQLLYISFNSKACSESDKGICAFCVCKMILNILLPLSTVSLSEPKLSRLSSHTVTLQSRLYTLQRFFSAVIPAALKNSILCGDWLHIAIVISFNAFQFYFVSTLYWSFPVRNWLFYSWVKNSMLNWTQAITACAEAHTGSFGVLFGDGMMFQLKGHILHHH